MIHLGKTQRVQLFQKEFQLENLRIVIEDLSELAIMLKMQETFLNVTHYLWEIIVEHHTFPYIEAKNKTAQIEHEATTSKIEKIKFLL
ncbi:MAG: hypothetical protein CM15mP22_1350 [Gammaproteobacteria bacterium]|nr:MAG: hypothetical protein CM15mP22_1350 [Gammaproteobacteria bacterium]